MYATRPTRGGALDGDWGIREAVRMTFPGPAEIAGDATHIARLDTYMGDMLRPYALGLETGALAAGRGQSYGDMAEALIGVVVPPGEQIDLVVLAIAIPDVTPGRATATYLSYVCPGTPMAFAICDQGTAAGFTGLRLIRDYAAAGQCRRALLLVVEQADLPYDPGVPVAVPTGHTGVAVLFGAAATGIGRPHTVRNHPDVVAGDVPAVLAKQIDALTGGADDPTVIVGAALAGVVPDGLADVRVAAAGQPYTGVWSLFADAVTPGDHDGRIVLADYDAGLGYLSVASVDFQRRMSTV